jgi:hypothetical protein
VRIFKGNEELFSGGNRLQRHITGHSAKPLKTYGPPTVFALFKYHRDGSMFILKANSVFEILSAMRYVQQEK